MGFIVRDSSHVNPPCHGIEGCVGGEEGEGLEKKSERGEEKQENTRSWTQRERTSGSVSGS